MKTIKDIFEINTGTLCVMDDESHWLRNKEGTWEKIRLSKKELQDDFDKLNIKE